MMAKMAKRLTLISFSLKATVFHLSVLAITLRYAKTDKVLTEGDIQAKPSAPTSGSTETHGNGTNYPHPFIFFMHDILGGSAPSERIVAGIIASTQTINLPFSKPNNRVFPMKGSIPLVDTSSGTNPELSSLKNGSPMGTVVISNIDKNKVVIDHRSTIPYVTPSQLPLEATLENHLFGRITVIDDEITQGHELGSIVIGKAQGFHLASSLDGSSKTMAFAALFHNEDHEEEDAISFFGVHRTAAHESYIAVVGGTGKYDNAKGCAKIETLHLPDHHTTNGVETLLQITVYLSLASSFH